MFDRYYVSSDFTCPNCNTLQNCKTMDFQTNQLQGKRNSYKLGDKIPTSLAKITFMTACSEVSDKADLSIPDNPKIIKGKCIGMFWCHVYLDGNKRAIREVVTSLDYKTELNIVMHDKRFTS